jgi:hypothetical protein
LEEESRSEERLCDAEQEQQKPVIPGHRSSTTRNFNAGMPAKLRRVYSAIWQEATALWLTVTTDRGAHHDLPLTRLFPARDASDRSNSSQAQADAEPGERSRLRRANPAKSRVRYRSGYTAW